MPLTWGSIEGWSASTMDEAAVALRKVMEDVGEQASDLATERAPRWQGAAATAARTQRDTIVRGLRRHHHQVRTVLAQLDKASNELAVLEREIDGTLSLAAAWQFSISPDGQVHDQTRPLTFHSDSEQIRYLDHREWQRSELVAMVSEAVTKATSIDDGLLALLGLAAQAQCQASGSPTEGDLHLAAVLAKHGVKVLPTDPAQLLAFWEKLAVWERDTLIAGDPQFWGNANGVPATDRDRANRLVLEQELDRFAQWFTDRGLTAPRTLDELEHYRTGPGREVVFPAGERKELAEGSRRFRVALSTLESLNNPLVAGVATGLWAYDSAAFGGKGRVAIAYGEDVDAADNLAVMVSGMDSNATKMDQIGVNAARLQEEGTQADPGATTAVIAWQCYDAPDKAEAPFEDKAMVGAALLAADVAALGSTRRRPSKPSIFGHSYGSTTVSLALQREGLAEHVDQVVLTGSPGAGGDARSVRDLNLRRGQVYVASASRDPVTTTGQVHGADPAREEFGATRVKAENVDRGARWNPLDTPSHSDYTSRLGDPEALYAMGLIVTGRESELAAGGMLAEHRRTELRELGSGAGTVPTLVDPESLREPTTGHVHG